MIRVSHLTIGYGSVAILKDLSFEIDPGECLLLAGPNGCGKSTLMRTLAGVLPPIEGSLPAPSGTDGDAGKGFHPVLIPTGIPKVRGFTTEEFIRTGCYTETDWRGAFPPAKERKMEKAADLLGIRPLLNRDIATLSDGQFQLACIATGLTRRCDLLLLDEPTAFLDVDNRIMVLRALKRAASEAPVLFSSHDIQDAAPLADRIFAISPEGALEISGQDSPSKEAVLRHAFKSL